MGSNLTPAQSNYKEQLRALLLTQGCDVSEKELTQFLKAIKTRCPWLLQEEILDLKSWENLEPYLKEDLETMPLFYFKLCFLCKSAIQSQEEDSMSPEEPCHIADRASESPQETAKESSLDFPSSNPNQNSPLVPAEGAFVQVEGATAPSTGGFDKFQEILKAFQSLATTPSQPVSQACQLTLIEKALEEGHKKEGFPIPYNRGWLVHDNFPFSIIKELQASIHENGIASPFTKGIIEGIADSYHLTPWDWKLLVKTVLRTQEYVLWHEEFRHYLEIQARYNKAIDIPITLDMLLGQGSYAKLQNQLRLETTAYIQISRAAVRAWAQVPNHTSPAGSFTSVLQGASETYQQFVDRLQKALDRQVDDSEAKHILMLNLAYENANIDCKNMLEAIVTRPHTIAEMLRACQDVGTETHKAQVLATALKTVLGETPKTVKPKTKCPRCQRGYHWASQCHSKITLDGRPLWRNGRKGMGQRAPQTNQGSYQAQVRFPN